MLLFLLRRLFMKVKSNNVGKNTSPGKHFPGKSRCILNEGEHIIYSPNWNFFFRVRGGALLKVMQSALKSQSS